MAVFTPLSTNEVRELLSGYRTGELLNFEGIASGIENSNFFVDTDQGRFVLTIFERLDARELPFYLGLMKHLAEREVPCPNPIADRDGRLFVLLKDKPAALVSRLTGASVLSPSPAHCAEVGALLARMHVRASDYPLNQPNPRGRPWWEATAPLVAPFLTREQRELLDNELNEQRVFAASSDFGQLPAGPVHADLFRDNVLFKGEAGGVEAPVRLSGVIDFYFAGCDSWLYDLAVTVNDWCIDEASGALDAQRLLALRTAYERARELTESEIRAWPMMLRAAALRFWLSRLFDLHCPRPAQLVSPKDPAHFERILRLRRHA
jgi:homoserine kinase type II